METKMLFIVLAKKAGSGGVEDGIQKGGNKVQGKANARKYLPDLQSKESRGTGSFVGEKGGWNSSKQL